MGGTVRTVLKGSGGLIALYLVLNYATGAGKLMTTGGNTAVNLARTFQGKRPA